MSRLDDLKRSYGDTPEIALTEEQLAQKHEWFLLGQMAMEYPELANPAEYQRYLADPEGWLMRRGRGTAL
jgi:hypothetical protein